MQITEQFSSVRMQLLHTNLHTSANISQTSRHTRSTRIPSSATAPASPKSPATQTGQAQPANPRRLRQPHNAKRLHRRVCRRIPKASKRQLQEGQPARADKRSHSSTACLGKSTPRLERKVERGEKWGLRTSHGRDKAEGEGAADRERSREEAERKGGQGGGERAVCV